MSRAEQISPYGEEIDRETEKLTSPLPQATEQFVTEPTQPLPTGFKPHLSLQTSHTIPAMSVTPATPVGVPSVPTTPEKALASTSTSKSALGHQRSSSKLGITDGPSNYPPNKDEKPLGTGFVGGAVWGSLMNAANKVTDTISSLTTPGNSSGSQIVRSVSAAPAAEPSADDMSRPRSHTLPAPGSAPLLEANDVTEVPKTKAIDTLGEGELSLRELGFESDSGHLYDNSEDSSSRHLSLNGGPSGEENDRLEVSASQIKGSTTDLVVPVERLQTESTAKARRSLTVPTQGVSVAETGARTDLPDVRKPRRLSSLSRKSAARRNESVASHGSSETPLGDDIARGSRNRSSVGTTDGGFDSPKARPAAIQDATEDRENEDGLYIHGKDGKKQKVPITGFAVQSGKRNRDFHALFKSVEETDYLIEGVFSSDLADADYSCALSKEILVQGRMYVSEHYICFNSNIFGWVTNVHIICKIR